MRKLSLPIAFFIAIAAHAQNAGYEKGHDLKLLLDNLYWIGPLLAWGVDRNVKGNMWVKGLVLWAILFFLNIVVRWAEFGPEMGGTILIPAAAGMFGATLVSGLLYLLVKWLVGLASGKSRKKDELSSPS